MVINIFSAYFVPMLKDIKHHVLLQVWNSNSDAAAYEGNIDANMSKTSDEKEIDRHDSDLYWPTTIKDTIQWFSFLDIMEHTENILNPNKGIIPSLLKLFVLFELRLMDDGDTVEAIAIRFVNCKK